MDIAGYINEVLAVNDLGTATEHSYRPALQRLFASIDPDINVQNEPKQLTNVGAPDFSFSTENAAIGHCEAKTLGHDILKKQGYEKDQFERYTKGLPNLIYTNCFDFIFYEEGKQTQHITIAENMMGWQTKPEAFGELEAALKNFVAQRPQTIKSTAKLAELMAGKARMMKEAMFKSLMEDDDGDTAITGFHKAFKEMLIHDINREDFADVYAETVTYGMFAARLADPTKGSFSRYEAFDLLPASNPFLKKLFFHIAGSDLDERLKWIVDQLAEVFLAVDPAYLQNSFAKREGRSDPFIHFYEDFLSEYNPAKRKSRGVWYTPEPVVNFIVRAVDDVLKTEFDLPMGLADNSKIVVDWDTGQIEKGKAVTVKKELHRVQILDPATGTGTFLAEAITQIADRVKKTNAGSWSSYIENDLVPRIHGFELLMASYAMCHMKLHMVLAEQGYNPKDAAKRLQVYLTNSLEQGDREVRDLFGGEWLTEEARGANEVKRDQPIMCVIGNPPYSVSSTNSGEWITNLVETYKKDLNEKNIQPLSDDYIKFIRFAEHMIEKNGEGVLGFITNNSYLDGLIHRQMRQSLITTFDKVFIVDLHGNFLKQEVNPDGGLDKNVFDIRQGVSIIIGVKKASCESAPRIFHTDLWGSRKAKYGALHELDIKSSSWSELETCSPHFFLVPKDFGALAEYETGFSLNALIRERSTGVETGNDSRFVNFTPDEMTDNPEHFHQIQYRPFDIRTCYYTRSELRRPAFDNFKHMLGEPNIGLIFPRQISQKNWTHASVSEILFDNRGHYSSVGRSYFAPLYLYPDEQDLDQTRRINFDPKLWKKLQKLAKHPNHSIPDEVQTFDYIYGVLHSPQYRDTYAEFLKIDFPRIPWPSSPDAFWDISAKGTQLRELHLMKKAAIGETPYPFPAEGDSVVDKPKFEDGRVWINKDQYFADVPLIAWDFYIGGYQPAQKWLKDRKGRELSYDDVMHYQRIIKILSETDRIMKTIEMSL